MSSMLWHTCNDLEDHTCCHFLIRIHLNCHVDMRVNKKTGKKANPIISRNVTEMSKIASHMI